MAPRPLILALANPTPEILPEEVRAVRDDAVIATGRSDYPNQVNNVLCFPFIFRGALDVGATTITRPMEIAAVHAIAELARQEQSDVVAAAYGGIEDLAFGPEYLIPKPFDPRLIVKIAPAVAKAAMESGVATRPMPIWRPTANGCCSSCITAARSCSRYLRQRARCRPSAAASSTRRARMSGCCGRCKSPWMRSSPPRFWSAVPR